MFFNSLKFLAFLPIIFILYWLISIVFKNNSQRILRTQNVLLLLASYFFYASWDYKFLFLLIFSTFLDYFSGIKISEAKNQKNKKIWLIASICINLGFLGVFKYFNFFIGSFADLLHLSGIKIDVWTLNVVLPVGISFYTFHGISYVIDIYKDRIKTEYNFIDYAVFVSFFPLLVAGPIERASHLLPQIKQNRVFDYDRIVDGLRQILWGLFKKIVIADTCAYFINEAFSVGSSNAGTSQQGLFLIIGAILFGVQIYCDFSGYSDMALGIANMFGITLLRNFAYPYFSRSIAEFWRRWHISLSSWFRDYLYIPLGGNNGSPLIRSRNILIVFLVSGFWHGAKWNFIVWGALHALYILPSIWLKTNRNHLEIVAKDKILPSLRDFANMLMTFLLVTFAWIFFRANTLSDAFSYIRRIFTTDFFVFKPTPYQSALPFLLLILIISEWFCRNKAHVLENINKNISQTPIRWALYLVIIGFIFYFSNERQEFIYFQF